MKTISNYLLIFAGFTLPLLFSNKSQIKTSDNKPPYTIDCLTVLKSKISKVNHQIDSIDALTDTTIKNNNEVLQNTKEVLLYVDKSLDSLSNKKIDKITYILDSVAIK